MEKDLKDKKELQQLRRKVNSLASTVSKLKKYEQLYTVAVDSAPIGMITLTIDGQISKVNKAFCQMLGYTKKELLTFNISQITHNDDLQIGLDVIRKLQSGKAKNATFEKRYIHKKGHAINVQLSTALLSDELLEPKNLFTQVIDISLQKEYEANIIKSEYKYKSLVDSVRDIIIVIQDDVIKFANQRAVELYGAPLNKIINQPLLKFVHPESVKMVTQRYADWRNGKKVSNDFRLKLINSKKEKVKCDVCSSTIIYEGKPSELVIFHDVTNIIVAEEALYQSKARYRDLVEKAGIAIVIDDKHGNVVYFNEQFSKLFGYSNSEIQNQNIRKFIFPDDIEKVMGYHSSRMLGKKLPKRYVFRGIKKDGKKIYLEIDANQLTKGKSVIGTRSYLWDVTERKISEGLQSEQDQIFNLLTTKTLDAIWTTDLEFNMTYVNTAIFNFLGYTPDEFLGLKPTVYTPPEGMKALQSAAEQLFTKEQKGEIGQIKFELQQIRKDGTLIDVEITANLYHDAKGKLLGFQGRSIDITKRKLAEKALKQKTLELSKYYEDSEVQRVATISVLADLNSTTKKLQEEINVRKKSEDDLKNYRNHLEELVSLRTAKLEEANKELEAFSYSVSHDLRAPLRAIDGFTRILIEDYASKLDKEGNRLGAIIQRNAQKMGHLIDDLLAFSRLGRATMTITKIDMTKIVNNIYQEAINEEERKRIKFSITDLPQIKADAKMMRQVWVNLISNAIKFTSNRKQAIITITSKEEKDQLTFCIKDNGAGFDMKYGDKLFGVFQRLHGENQFEGTGVGLALIQRIIKRYDGDVWAEGKVDKGASFYFSLPKIKKAK